MHILYTIAGTYRAAGMERVLADKANALIRRGHSVTIVTTEQQGRADAFPLDQAIRRFDLGIGYEDDNGGSFLHKVLHYPGKQLRHRRRLSALLRQLRPDITVSMFCGDEGFLPRIPDGSKKLLEIHFSRLKRLQYGRKGLWAWSDRWRSRQDLRHVRRFDSFVVLTPEDRAYWGALPNICVIPNAVPLRAPVLLQAHTLVAVGRYSYQKGLDRLLDAWALVRRGDWRLRLVGDGELRPALAAQIERLGLGESVELTGVCQDMDAVYAEASLLVLSSRYEGLPMVLLEAQSRGIPAVAFSCPCGPRDVLEDGKTGLLVPEGDVPALSAAIQTLLDDPARLRAMGAAAHAAALRWDPERIMDQWIQLFEDILSSRP